MARIAQIFNFGKKTITFTLSSFNPYITISRLLFTVKYRQSPIKAAKKKNLSQIKKYIPIDVNLKNAQGYAPLHIIAANNDLNCAPQLLLNGANLEVKDNNGDTPLMLAGKNHQFQMVKYLLEANADVNAANTQGENICHLVINALRPHVDEDDIIDIFKELIKHNVDVNKQNNEGNSPLMAIVLKYKIGDATPSHRFWERLVNLLIINKANPYLKNKALDTPLLQALILNKMVLTDYLTGLSLPAQYAPLRLSLAAPKPEEFPREQHSHIRRRH